MVTNESNSHIFVAALMSAVAIPSVIDIPMSGILTVFDDDEEAEDLSSMGLLYTGLQLTSVIGFAMSLCFAIMNNLFVNILPDQLVPKFLNDHTFVMRTPVVLIKLSFFCWIASLGILAWVHFCFLSLFFFWFFLYLHSHFFLFTSMHSD